MPVIMGGREGGGGFTPKAGTVTHVVYVNAGDRPPHWLVQVVIS